MNATLFSIAWRLALCAGFSYAAWSFGGPVTAMASVPLVGILLARPLIDLASHLRHGIRAAAYRELEGNYYVFQGTPVRVIEDQAHRRWISAADVRRIVGPGASDAALARLYPDGWRSFGRPAQPHFSDDALLLHLAKSTTAAAGKFRQWVEREVAYPARQLRDRSSARNAGPEAPESD